MKNKLVKIAKKKHKPIVYRYYDWLQENAYGKENAIKRKDLAEIFNTDLSTQKSILREINESEDLHKLISTSNAIYMCKTQSECNKAIHNEIKSGLTRLLKGKKMASKTTKNNQFQLLLGNYQKEFITVFEN